MSRAGGEGRALSERPLSFVDRPNSYIGRSVPRPDAQRLLQGRGVYVDDIRLPRLLHAAFLRSPYAHARVKRIDTEAAARCPGVVRVVTAAELAGAARRRFGIDALHPRMRIGAAQEGGVQQARGRMS